MTIIEKNSINTPWLFRTRPLQTEQSQSVQEVRSPTTVEHNQRIIQQQPSPVQMPVVHAQKSQPQLRVSTGPITIDPRKVVKSSTAPNLRTSNSLSTMFRVI